MNKTILTGRLTKDIEIRNTNDGTPYTFFQIAVNGRKAGTTTFVPCIAWRQTAELMKKYLSKGSLIGVEGRLDITQTKDGEDFTQRTSVIVEKIDFLESKAQAEARKAGNVAEDEPIIVEAPEAEEVNLDEIKF